MTRRPTKTGASPLKVRPQPWCRRNHETRSDDFAWQIPVNVGSGVNATGFEGGLGYFENEDGGGAQFFFNRNPAPVASGGDLYVSKQAGEV